MVVSVQEGVARLERRIKELSTKCTLCQKEPVVVVCDQCDFRWCDSCAKENRDFRATPVCWSCVYDR